MWQLIKTVLRIIGYVWAYSFIAYGLYQLITGTL